MRYLYLAFIFLFVTACGESQKTSKTMSENDQAITVPNGHTSQNSLDWSGTYSGTLPCASCSAIKMTIVLEDDNSYEQTNVYVHDRDSDAVIVSGTFTWNEKGNKITLLNVERPNQFFVGENYLVKLDINGERVTGELAEKYILSKE